MSNNHLNKTQTQALLAQVTIREATVADEGSLQRLAQLDSARPVAAPVLLAEVGGELRAAVSTLDGRTIADPFHPAEELTAILRTRAGFTRVVHSSPIKALGRSLWKRPLAREPRAPRPSSPSVPGIPHIPARLG